MSGPRPIDIIPDVTNVNIEDVNRTITVVDDCSGTSIDVLQPQTTVIQISDAGLQGPQGPQGQPGEPGATQPFSNLIGSTWFTTASIQITGSQESSDLFLVKGPYTSFLVSNSLDLGAIISSSANNTFTIFGPQARTLFSISSSGVYQFATQSTAPVANDTKGLLWFTNTDLYINLD